MTSNLSTLPLLLPPPGRAAPHPLLSSAFAEFSPLVATADLVPGLRGLSGEQGPLAAVGGTDAPHVVIGRKVRRGGAGSVQWCHGMQMGGLLWHVSGCTCWTMLDTVVVETG